MPAKEGFMMDVRREDGLGEGQEGKDGREGERQDWEEHPRIKVFDLHCDTLDRLALSDGALYPGFAEQSGKMGIDPDRMVSLKDNDAHLSLDRMSGFDWCQCFAIFLPDGLGAEESWALFEHVKAFFDSQLDRFPEDVEQVGDAHALDDIVQRGRCAAILTVEGAPFIEGSLSCIEKIAAAGVKMLTLTWNGPNAIASGNDTSEGMTLFGNDVVHALEASRIIVDASHLNDKSFSGLAATATRPFVASHSNSRAVCAHPRNLTDYQFETIAERGGIVGLNLCNQFLSQTNSDPTPGDVLRHIDHWLELGGMHAIALGTDYDGADVPSWLSAGEKLPALYTLMRHEFGAAIADRLFFDNARAFFIGNERV